MLLTFFLKIFALYLLLYFVLIIYLKKRSKSHRDGTVSNLASSKKPWGTIFNISTLLYGLLSLSLPIAIVKLLGINLLTAVGSTFVGLTAIATILVGLFPTNKFPKKHDLVGMFSFANVFLTALVFIFIVNRYEVFPNFLIYICWWVMGSILPLAFASKKNPSYSFFEWLTFIGTIVWNFSLALVLLINL